VSVAATILPSIIQRFSKVYPRVILHMEEVPPPSRDLGALRDRAYDFILGRMVTPLADNLLGDDVNVEFLFDDPLVIVTGIHNPWGRRRKVDLKELVDEPWILTPPETWHYSRMLEAFRARGLGVPNIQLLSLSVPLRVQLLANGRYVTALAKTVAKQYALTILPVDLPNWPCPVVIVTLKNRTLSPVVERFIEHVREFTAPIRGK
jgi:DNA-binding transcriptional LysR family regulator